MDICTFNDGASAMLAVMEQYLWLQSTVVTINAMNLKKPSREEGPTYDAGMDMQTLNLTRLCNVCVLSVEGYIIVLFWMS